MYSGIIDLDMLAINKMPSIFKRKIKKKINMVYDLNDQFNKSYNEKIMQSLKFCNNLSNNTPNWYGGEFICGSPQFFNKIYNNIIKLIPNYLNNLKNIHHHGDEMLLNASLQLIKNKNKNYFSDISNNKIITRYWSINTLHKKKKIEFYLKHFLIHLPSDKLYLSNINLKKISLDEINLKLGIYLNSYSLKYRNLLKKFYHKIIN